LPRLRAVTSGCIEPFDKKQALRRAGTLSCQGGIARNDKEGLRHSLEGEGERGRLSLLKLDKEQRHLHTEFVTMNDEQ